MINRIMEILCFILAIAAGVNFVAVSFVATFSGAMQMSSIYAVGMAMMTFLLSMLLLRHAKKVIPPKPE